MASPRPVVSAALTLRLFAADCNVEPGRYTISLLKSVAFEYTSMPLSLRHAGPSPPDPDRKDYVVMDDGREVGRIYEDRTTPPELRWYWSIIVVRANHAGIKTSGRAATFETAKAEFQANWAKLEVES